jgi:DNA polymerase-3 subunit epsilon
MKRWPDLHVAQHAADLLKAGLMIIDLETTAPSDDPAVAIVEIGIIDQRGNVRFHSFVQPNRRITREAAGIHGLDNRDVAGAPSFRQIYSSLADCLNGEVVVAYNTVAEQKVLDVVCRRDNLPLLQPGSWQDAAELYARYRRSDRYFRLTEACRREDLPIDGAHRALGDCRLTLALLNRMAAALER